MNRTLSSRTKYLTIVIIVAIITFTSAMLLPGQDSQEKQIWSADLNNNQINEEYILYQERVTVCEGGNTIWQSPGEWQVDQAIIGDVTNDGNQELVLLLWKPGSFGPSRPFWVKGEDKAWSNHLFVYTLAGNHFKQVWCSSALNPPLQDLQIVYDPGGQNYLTAREEPYAVRNTVRLKWDEWGFIYFNN